MDTGGYDNGDGAAGPPEGSKHPNEQEQQQHIPDGFNALPGHLKNFPEGEALFAAVEEENDVAGGQGPQNFQLQDHARQKCAQKQQQGSRLHMKTS